MVFRNKRALSLVLVIALFVGLVSGFAFRADAATVDYVTGTPTKVSGYSNIIKNWGTRGTEATFLSPNAIKFYEENNTTYGALAALSGASDPAAVPSSALYKKLNKLVTDNQTKETTYADTRYLFPYTDCQNSGLTGSAISSFYSGTAIGPNWDNGRTWNREHTWPNSKGDANGAGETDIMMLRPTAADENISRSNMAYGESACYYFPNKESGGAYDVRGDVARIMLYVYTRWGTEKMWGTTGVIESKEVLLKWMAEDPVDTWEMGRNDSVESITGTRNVYVDYPELAFLLMGEEVPADMLSPSNGDGSIPTMPPLPVAPTDPKQILQDASALAPDEILPYTATLTGKITAVNESYNSQYENITVTIVVPGFENTPVRCYRMRGTGVDKIGVGDTVTVCGNLTKYRSGNSTAIEFTLGAIMLSYGQNSDPALPENVTIPTPGVAYKFGMVQEKVSTSKVYYLKGGMDGYYMATTTDESQAIDVYLENTSGGYYLYTLSGNTKQYINMVANGNYVNGAYQTTAATVYTFDQETGTLVATVKNTTYRFGTRSDKSYTTIGPVSVKSSNFFCTFYGATPATLPGDITGDSGINNDDVIALLWHTLFPEKNPITVNADLNRDGSVNNEDVIVLLWHTLFPEENPL